MRFTEHRANSTRFATTVTHVVVVLPPGDEWHGVPGWEAAAAALARAGRASADLTKWPVTIQLPTGQLSSWVRVDPAASAFERHSVLRRCINRFMGEQPRRIDIEVTGSDEARATFAADATLVVATNATPLRSWKQGKAPQPVGQIVVHGWTSGNRLAPERARAEGNHLCRELTHSPTNELTPASYRRQLRELAAGEGWKVSELPVSRLQRMGAGAFCAVARGSSSGDAAIVRVTYDGTAARRKGTAGPTVALVGKGICFDTGGHNLKPARGMYNMHHDMSGSAVVVGAMLAASRLRLPLRIDGWLALARNELSPSAYTQNEVVTALNGTTIEVTHTDAEGRMVLADTLTLACRQSPDLVIDYATLTGAMCDALGSRMSGVLSNRADLSSRLVAAGDRAGERLVPFPMPDDYDEALESKVADVKQCVHEDGAADHIYAARFLSRFVDDRPWAHIDLSSYEHKGGLGAVLTDLTGFGVGLTVEALVELAG